MSTDDKNSEAIDSKTVPAGLRRRTMLKTTAGVAGLGLLAGCTGNGDDGDAGDGGDGGDSGDGGDGGNGDDGTDFPERDMRLIIPYSPGGGYDAYTRLSAEHLSNHLPNEVNVQAQNVEGAGGIIGTEEIYNADPDGHTGGIINVGKLGRDQIIDDVDFDLRNLTYYATVALEVPLITLGSHVDIDSWEEFVEQTANGDLMFGTTGPASTTAANAYLPGEVSGEYGIDTVLDNSVVYDGTSQMVQAVLREDIDVIAVAYSSALSYVQDGSVEPFLYLSMDDEPPEDVPEAETLATAGVNNGQEVADIIPARRSFAGPPDIPDDVTRLLRDAFETMLTGDDDFLDDADDAGRPITYQDGEETAEAITGYVEGWMNQEDILQQIAEA